MDHTGNTHDGWESSPSIAEFPVVRSFSPLDRYRRRRLFRRRTGEHSDLFVDTVNAFHQPSIRFRPMRMKGSKPEREPIRIGIQVDGGEWALTSQIPAIGSIFGALRVARARWPNIAVHSERGYAVSELCYHISPLDGDWGDFSRLMLITARFLIRNDSKKIEFEVKQTGALDSSAVRICPNETAPFHWADSRLPELISVRPISKEPGLTKYQWSGGFDPLSIGVVPLRIRKMQGRSTWASDSVVESNIWSVKMESAIRPKTRKSRNQHIVSGGGREW